MIYQYAHLYSFEYKGKSKRIDITNNKLKESPFHKIELFTVKYISHKRSRQQLQLLTSMPSKSKCPICMCNISLLANTNKCKHDFCKECLMKWSKESANVCPICKIRFNKVIIHLNNQKVEIPVKYKSINLSRDPFYSEYYPYDSDGDSLSTDSGCYVCDRNDDHENLLVCDSCEFYLCHYYCDNLSSIPDNDWICIYCRRNKRIQQAQTRKELRKLIH